MSTSTTTLRTLLEARRSEGRRFALAEAIATIVPLCLDLQERHGRGERLYVHPSCVAPGPDGLAKLAPRLATLPQAARDRACLAPELQSTLAPGDAKASVFSVGAILYEMITGVAVGPGMPRPREVDPTIATGVELLLEKALIADPAHRPADIGALASALYHVAPEGSLHPPEVDPKNLDHTGEYDVDVRLSLMAPEEVGVAATRVPTAPAMPRLGLDPYGAPVSAPAPSRGPNLNERLTALKAHLESDPRPRYVVNKDKMDHGPFSAVELLQQIASHTFTSDHSLRDELSGQTHPIKDWEQFAPFAEQSALKREIVAEEKEVRRVVRAEKTGAAAKSTIAVAVVGALIAGAAIWFVTVRGSRKDDVEVADDPNALDLSLDGGGVHGGARHAGRRAGGAAGGGGGGGFPGGMSYEAAIASNNTEVTIGQASGPDLTDSQLSAPMRNASFLGGCGAPNSMKVTVRVAIKMGRAVGVSVYTNPSNSGVASCVERAVRNISWPPNPKMDSFTTTY